MSGMSSASTTGKPISVARPPALRRRLPEIIAGRVLELADRGLRLAVHHEGGVLAVAGLQRIDQVDQHVGRIARRERAGGAGRDVADIAPVPEPSATVV